MRLLLTILASLTLCGCGLQPLYSGGAREVVAERLGSIEVAPIEGRAGWLLRNALNDRLHLTGRKPAVRFRLDVQLDDSLEALGVLNDDTISRERRILRARYQLIDTGNGNIILDGTAGSDAGIDVVSSEYATIAAEQTALENLAMVLAERMVRQIALTLRVTE